MPELRRISQRVMSSPFYVLATLLSLGGCGSAELFRAYPAVESPGVDKAPWPKLAAGPTRSAALKDAPDPATGAAVASGLRAETAAANAAAASLAGPVVDAEALRAAAAAQRARAEAQAAAEPQDLD